METKRREIDFTQVLDDHRLWEQVPKGEPLGAGNPNFLWGIATSTFQDSGGEHCPASQWASWEKKCLPDGYRSGSSVNLFQLYAKAPHEVITRLQNLGLNTYRFSIEWSQIEPVKGSFDADKLRVYVEFCKALKDQGIEPMITLHHFSEPHWFHEMGSFQKEENTAFFLRFCTYVFKELIQDYKGKTLVRYFCTINEPGVEAHSRYLMGFFSPGLKYRFVKGARLLRNLLKAHCKVYETLKEVAHRCGKPEILIGITHQYLKMLPINPLMYPLARLYTLYNETVLHFFKTGVFSYKFYPFSKIVEDCSRLHPQVDFVGVQFYGRVYLNFFGVDPRNKPKTTMEGVYEDPEGLYEAMLECFFAFKAPLIVTENGISTDCETQRARYLERALQTARHVEKKIGSQHLLGYILWSFCDNFEWSFGWKPRFGAYALTKDRNMLDAYKPGVQPFVDTIKAWRATF